MSAIDFEAEARRTLTDESEPSRTRVKNAVLVLLTDGELATPSTVSKATGIDQRSVERHLRKLRQAGRLTSLNGVYSPMNDDREADRKCRSTPQKCRSDRQKVSVKPTESVGLPPKSVGGPTESVGGTPVATRARNSSQKHIYTYPPTPLPANKGSPDLAGGLAGSVRTSDFASGEAPPRQGEDGADQGADPGWPDFRATVDPDLPDGWMYQLGDLIASKMPRRRGRFGEWISPLTADLEMRVARVINQNGGWRRFDEHIRPLLEDFDQEIKSPHRLIATLYRQVDSGTAHRRPVGAGGKVPAFVAEGFVERFGGDERAATMDRATSIAATSNPETPFYGMACSWLAARATEPDVAHFITEYSWVFVSHYRDALTTAHQTMGGRPNA